MTMKTLSHEIVQWVEKRHALAVQNAFDQVVNDPMQESYNWKVLNFKAMDIIEKELQRNIHKCLQYIFESHDLCNDIIEFSRISISDYIKLDFNYTRLCGYSVEIKMKVHLGYVRASASQREKYHIQRFADSLVEEAEIRDLTSGVEYLKLLGKKHERFTRWFGEQLSLRHAKQRKRSAWRHAQERKKKVWESNTNHTAKRRKLN